MDDKQEQHYVVVVHGIGEQVKYETLVHVIQQFAWARRTEGKAKRSRKGYKPEMKFPSRDVRRTTTFESSRRNRPPDQSERPNPESRGWKAGHELMQ